MYANEETIQAIIDETLLRIPDKDEHKQFWKNTCIDITNFENKSIENLEPGAYIHYGALDSVYDLFPTESFSVKRNPETVAILTSCEMFVLEVERRYKQLRYQLSGGGYVEFTDFACKLYVYNATDIDGSTGNFSRQFDFLWRSSWNDGHGGGAGKKSTLPWYIQSETFQEYVNDKYVSTTFGYDSIVHKKGSSEYVYSFPEETGTIALSENIPTKLSDLTNDSGYITIGSVGNGTLTIQKNGTNVATFTANQSSNSTVDITVPTKLSDLTNDTGYITIGSVGNGILTITQNGTNKGTFSANQSSNSTVDITVPTKVSQLTNDSGYTTNTGTVTQVKVGSTAYNPSSGVVSLPAYPTTLPASDVYAWAKASSKPSYTASEVGALPRIVAKIPVTTSPSAGWRRICKITDGNYGYENGFVTISGDWDNGAPSNAIISICCRHTIASMNLIHNIATDGMIQQVRLVNISGGTYWFDAYMKGMSGEVSEQYFIFFGNFDISDIQNSATIITDGTASASVDLTTTAVIGTLITSKNIGSQSVSYANTAGSAPASDVYAWAKASSKPSYTASEVGALPLSGGTMTGTINTPENNVALNFRPDHAAYSTTISYQNFGNEALVFATKMLITSFIFVNGEDSVTNHDSDRWQSLTPGLQIKNNKVAIGKLIANGVTPTYALDVNGTVNATSFEGSGASLTGVNADALQNSTPDESAGASTIVKRTAAGQVRAVYYNMSGDADNINSFTSNVAFVSSDGWIRQTSKANFSTWLLTWTKLGSTTGNTVLTYTGTYTEFFVVLDLGFYAETFYFVASALGGNRYFFGGTTNTSDGSSWVLRAGRSNSTYSFKADRVHQDGTDYTSQVNVSVYAR